MAAADTPPFAVNNPDEDEEGHKPSYAAVASGVAHADDLVVEEAEELDAPLLKAESAVGAGSFGPHPGSLTASVGNNNKQQDKPQQQPSAPAATAGFRPPLPAKPAPRTKTVVKNAAGVHALSAGEKCIQGITNPITVAGALVTVTGALMLTATKPVMRLSYKNIIGELSKPATGAALYEGLIMLATGGLLLHVVRNTRDPATVDRANLVVGTYMVGESAMALYERATLGHADEIALGFQPAVLGIGAWALAQWRRGWRKVPVGAGGGAADEK